MHNCLYAVSMHVRAYISMYVRMGGWMDGWIDAWISCGCMYHAGWMDACMDGWTHVRSYMFVCLCVFMYACMFPCL